MVPDFSPTAGWGTLFSQIGARWFVAEHAAGLPPRTGVTASGDTKGLLYVNCLFGSTLAV